MNTSGRKRDYVPVYFFRGDYRGKAGAGSPVPDSQRQDRSRHRIFQMRGTGGTKGDNIINIKVCKRLYILKRHLFRRLFFPHHQGRKPAAGLIQGKFNRHFCLLKQFHGSFQVFRIDKILDTPGKKGDFAAWTFNRRIQRFEPIPERFIRDGRQNSEIMFF